MRKILDTGARFTAIQASNDGSAIGAMVLYAKPGCVFPRTSP